MLGFLSEDYAKVRPSYSGILLTLTGGWLTQSEEELTLAFYNCHIDAKRNQECVYRDRQLTEI